MTNLSNSNQKDIKRTTLPPNPPKVIKNNDIRHQVRVEPTTCRRLSSAIYQLLGKEANSWVYMWNRTAISSFLAHVLPLTKGLYGPQHWTWNKLASSGYTQGSKERGREKERWRKIPHSKMVNFYATQRWLTSMESRRTFVRKGVVWYSGYALINTLSMSCIPLLSVYMKIMTKRYPNPKTTRTHP